jgi:four helix bundle protein
MAKGSNREVRSQLYVAKDQECLSQEAFDELKNASLSLARPLANFIKYLEGFPGNRRIRENP